MKLAYGNYGMPRTPWPEMLRLVADIGYDGVEVCVGPIYPTAPEQMSADDRARFRDECGTLGLGIASLLAVGASLLEPDPLQHAANLRRLTEVVALGQDLGMATPVVVNTLGGKSAEWETERDQMLQRVRDWSRAARGAGGVFAIEPHVGGMIDSPDRARWLLDALGGDAGVNFDYSHFELKPTRLDESMDALLPRALGIHVKDVTGPYPSVRFLLPGEGTLDYAAYFRELIARGYDGWVTVEISGQIFNAAGYDAERAARFSYDTLSRAARAAGVARPDRTSGTTT
jgi:hexulose-6-phosphate isomerase